MSLLWSLCTCALLACALGSPITNRAISGYHNYDGAFIDQVQGKAYRCAGDIAIVVDISGSVGSETMTSYSFSAISNIVGQLARLPRANGDNTIGYRVSLVSFAKEAIIHDLDLLGATASEAAKKLGKALNNIEKAGGTCTSCGLAKGVEALKNGRADVPKNIMLISDGLDNTGDGSVEIHNSAKEAGIKISAIGVRGEMRRMDEEFLKSISDGYNSIRAQSDTMEVAVGLVDKIAGTSCSPDDD